MNSVPKILVRASALAAGVASIMGLSLLTACGQKGNLYLPDDPDFKQRATLPDIVRRQFPDMPPPRVPGAQTAPGTPNAQSTPAPANTLPNAPANAAVNAPTTAPTTAPAANPTPSPADSTNNPGAVANPSSR